MNLVNNFLPQFLYNKAGRSGEDFIEHWTHFELKIFMLIFIFRTDFLLENFCSYKNVSEVHFWPLDVNSEAIKASDVKSMGDNVEKIAIWKRNENSKFFLLPK